MSLSLRVNIRIARGRMLKEKYARMPCGKVYTVYKRLCGCQGKSVGLPVVEIRDKLN
jgi:hypothetical protein